MKAILLLNGEPYPHPIHTEGAYVYCCDGAYNWAHGRVRIDENVGDFDSLSIIPSPPPREVYPSEKDKTDGELALDLALSAGATQIDIYGGGGGREDHFLGNLHLLYKAHRAGVRARMITERSVFLIGEGEIHLPAPRSATFSVVPFGGDAHILHSSGLKYPMEDLWLRYGSTRGISNVTERDDARFFSEGTVLVIVNSEKEGA